MNLKPSHPRETILEALDALRQLTLDHFQGEKYAKTQVQILQTINNARSWAHNATTLEERVISNVSPPQ